MAMSRFLREIKNGSEAHFLGYMQDARKEAQLTVERNVDMAGALLTVDAADARPGIRTVPKSHGKSSSFVLNVLKLVTR